MTRPAWLDLPTRTGRRAALAQAGVAALGGAMWVIASPPYGAWPVAWLAMLPTLWLIGGAPSARTAGRHAWISGAVTTLGGFYWMAPLLQQHAGVPWPLAILLLLVFAAYQGLSLLLAARAIWWIRAGVRVRGRALPMALVAPVAVIALEHALPVLFPYTLAISQVPALRIIQIADLFGAAAIAALLIACAGAAWDLVDRGRAAWRSAAVVGGLVVATLLYGAWRLDDVAARRAAAPHLRVGLVQPNEAMHLGGGEPRSERALLVGMQAESARLEAAGAQLVVWSETSYPVTLTRDLERDLAPASPWRVRRGFTVPVVIGTVTSERTEGARYYNSSLLFVGDQLAGRQDKVHRVLGSESNPLVEWFPSIGSWMPGGFSGGDRAVAMQLQIGDLSLRLGVMICLEDTLGGYGREVAATRPNLLVNQTIDTWFGSHAEPFQHRALAVLRAVEVRADMVRSVNTGPSGLILATGELGPQSAVRSGEHLPVEGMVVDAAVMEAGHSLYATIGDVLPWTCLALTMIGWWLGRGGRRPKPKRAV